MSYGTSQLLCWHKEIGVIENRPDAHRACEERQGKSRRRALLDRLYQQYWLELRNYIYKTFGSGPPEPEDVVQTSFARLAAVENLDAIDNPRAFLYAASRNLVIDYQRHLKTSNQYVEQLQSDLDHQVDEITPERIFIEKQRLQVVVSTLKKMPEKRRSLLLLNRFDGLGFVEIGRKLGISESGVRKHVKRALEECMNALSALEEESEKINSLTFDSREKLSDE